jgi:hypothetical protein
MRLEASDFLFYPSLEFLRNSCLFQQFQISFLFVLRAFPFAQLILDNFQLLTQIILFLIFSRSSGALFRQFRAPFGDQAFPAQNVQKHADSGFDIKHFKDPLFLRNGNIQVGNNGIRSQGRVCNAADCRNGVRRNPGTADGVRLKVAQELTPVGLALQIPFVVDRFITAAFNQITGVFMMIEVRQPGMPSTSC